MAKGKKTGGRNPGSPNRITRDLREMIEGALSDLGGQDWLVQAANAKPAAFLALIGRLLPKDIVIDKRVRHVHELSRDELLAIASGSRPGAATTGNGQSEPPGVH
jgi:hypothetical protein